jgi:hypothetical protein
MGFAEHHTKEKNSEKLDKKFVSKLLQEVSTYSVLQNKSHLWTKEAKLEHTSKHANVNVSNNYKLKYNELVLKRKEKVIIKIGEALICQVNNATLLGVKIGTNKSRAQVEWFQLLNKDFS